jgi:hypothetical protein
MDWFRRRWEDVASAMSVTPPGLISVLRRLDVGDVEAALAFAAAAKSSGNTSVALALQSRIALLDPTRGVVARPGDLDRTPADEDERLALSVTGEALLYQRLLSLDGKGYLEVLALYRRLAQNAVHAEIALRLELAENWARLIGGTVPIVDVELESLRTRAVGLGASALAIEATVLRSLAFSRQDDTVALEKARTLGRRAAMMAQTEGLPFAQILAHLALARLRRVLGKPHLAVRILEALSAIAPPPWQPWLQWERLFVGLPVVPGEGQYAAHAAASGAAMMAAASDREPAVFLREKKRAAELVSGIQGCRDEFSALVMCVDPREAGTDAPDGARAFCTGERTLPPFGVHGAAFGGRSRVFGDSALAFVVAGPDQTSRRFLRPGLGLVVADGKVSQIAQQQRKQGRIDTAVAVLLQAGKVGLSLDRFFKDVYGFPFVPDLHKGTLDVLIHRMREHLGDLAEMQRHGDTLVVAPKSVIVVPDPRTAPSIDERVLQWLASQGSANAREAADRLEIPLRTVQSALAEMVSEGVLRSEGKGRSVRYIVEDTVFNEPTRS